MMQQLTDLGYLFACPKRDKEGRRVVVARPGKIIRLSTHTKLHWGSEIRGH